MTWRNIIILDPDDGTGAGTGDEEGPDPGREETGEGPDPGGQQQTGTVPRSELAKANAEAKKYRLQLREAQEKIKEHDDASKTELERERERANQLQQRATTLESQNLSLRASVLALEAGVSQEAARDAARLLNWDAIEDKDDDGQVLSALKDLVQEKPYLKGSGSGSADGGRGSSGGEGPIDMNAHIRRAAGR